MNGHHTAWCGMAQVWFRLWFTKVYQYKKIRGSFASL